MRERRRKLVLLAPLILLGFLLFVALGGMIVQQLWNVLLPPLFGWHLITFWQALGLLALCRILFGGFGIQGSRRSRLRHCMPGRWEAMPPEERERLRRGLRERFGFGSSAGESPEP